MGWVKAACESGEESHTWPWSHMKEVFTEWFWSQCWNSVTSASKKTRLWAHPAQTQWALLRDWIPGSQRKLCALCCFSLDYTATCFQLIALPTKCCSHVFLSRPLNSHSRIVFPTMDYLHIASLNLAQHKKKKNCFGQKQSIRKLIHCVHCASELV